MSASDILKSPWGNGSPDDVLCLSKMGSDNKK